MDTIRVNVCDLRNRCAARTHMTAASKIKTWYVVHKWTSLVCTLFLLIICLTGLPLVFHHEIEHWLDDSAPYATLPADAPRASLDTLIAKARERYPNEVVMHTFIDDEEPQVLIGMAPSTSSPFDLMHSVKFDARTGDILQDGPKLGDEKFTFMGIMLALHVDLYAGLAGELFLGFMGLLFVIAIVSGVVLYGPFMKKTAVWHDSRRALTPSQVAGSAQSVGRGHAGMGLCGGAHRCYQRALDAPLSTLAIAGFATDHGPISGQTAANNAGVGAICL